MHVHIIKDAENKDIVAVFASTGSLTPSGLATAVEKAMDDAIQNDSSDMLESMTIFLSESYPNVIRLDSDDSGHNHCFSVSEF